MCVTFFFFFWSCLIELCFDDLGVFVLQVRIICGVEHDDLKRLFHVSKSIREAVCPWNQLI